MLQQSLVEISQTKIEPVQQHGFNQFGVKLEKISGILFQHRLLSDGNVQTRIVKPMSAFSAKSVEKRYLLHNRQVLVRALQRVIGQKIQSSNVEQS